MGSSSNNSGESCGENNRLLSKRASEQVALARRDTWQRALPLVAASSPNHQCKLRPVVFLFKLLSFERHTGELEHGHRENRATRDDIKNFSMLFVALFTKDDEIVKPSWRDSTCC